MSFTKPTSLHHSFRHKRPEEVVECTYLGISTAYSEILLLKFHKNMARTDFLNFQNLTQYLAPTETTQIKKTFKRSRK